MAKIWQAACHLCRATLSPTDRCIHLWMDEHGRVFRVSEAHQFEPEPDVVGKLVEVIDPKKGYRRPDIVLTPPAAETEGE
jgi:hypothetical protein